MRWRHEIVSHIAALSADLLNQIKLMPASPCDETQRKSSTKLWIFHDDKRSYSNWKSSHFSFRSRWKHSGRTSAARNMHYTHKCKFNLRILPSAEAPVISPSFAGIVHVECSATDSSRKAHISSFYASRGSRRSWSMKQKPRFSPSCCENKNFSLSAFCISFHSDAQDMSFIHGTWKCAFPRKFRKFSISFL